ncbi:hypothetical protein LQZ18_10520 [Lachnospiraceae bacterium ZAX-1]
MLETMIGIAAMVLLSSIAKYIKKKSSLKGSSSQQTIVDHQNKGQRDKQKKQSSYTPPSSGQNTPQQKQYILPTRKQYTPQEQKQYIPPTRKQYTPQERKQYIPQERKQYTPQERKQYILPTRKQYIPQERKQYIPPTKDKYVPLLSRENKQLSQIQNKAPLAKAVRADNIAKYQVQQNFNAEGKEQIIGWRASSQTVNVVGGQEWYDTKLMTEISDIMAKGIDTHLTYERDFIAEGMEMLNQIQA